MAGSGKRGSGGPCFQVWNCWAHNDAATFQSPFLVHRILSVFYPTGPVPGLTVTGQLDDGGLALLIGLTVRDFHLDYSR